jgi:hypothetical protein
MTLPRRRRRRFSRWVWAEVCGLVTLSKLEGGLQAQALCLAHGKAEYELAWVVRIEYPNKTVSNCRTREVCRVHGARYSPCTSTNADVRAVGTAGDEYGWGWLTRGSSMLCYPCNK